MEKITFFCLLLLGMACQSAPPDKAQVVQEVAQMLADYHTDIREGGLTMEFKYLDDSPDFFWVPPGYTSALNYDSVKTILEGNALAYQAIDFRWDTLDIIPLSNEIATYAGIVSGTMLDTAGVVAKVRMIESGTLIRRPEGWKLLSGQSAALPAEND